MADRSSETDTAALLSVSARQLLAWVAARPRSYAEAMDAWRTSCPRLSVWEDAVADGLIWVDPEDAVSQGQAAVRLTAAGAAALAGAGFAVISMAGMA